MITRLSLFVFAHCLIATASLGQDSTGPTKVSGIDKSLFSKEVEPGDNFYEYANEAWLASTDIPADKSDYGIFTILNDETQQQVRELIENAADANAAPGTPAQKVGDLYGSVLDLDARNEAGIEPIRPLLDEINAIDSAESLAAVMGKLSRRGVYGPSAAYVGVDAKNSDAYTVYVTQSGLTMPDRDYYLEGDERYVKLRAELIQYVAEMLAFVGDENPSGSADVVFDIEMRIAKSHWTKTENRDPEKTYNKKDAASVAEMLGDFKSTAFAKSAGLDGQRDFVIRQPSYLKSLGSLLQEKSLDDWKAYLRFHLIDTYGDNLSEEIERRHFDFHRTALSGISEQEPIWKRGVNVTGGLLGELVGQLYVEEHFRPEAKARMNELVENLKRAFAGRIETRDWMGPGTQKQALEKLELFTTKIGYPDEWKDYAKLTIVDGPLAENVIAAVRFEYDRDLAKLGGPIDRNEWHMTPQTINAYYNPTMNEIVFPAAILQPPFFNMAADDAVNYGGIGAVIGHELSHGFDDKGSKYDGQGNLRNWWTETDRAEFEERAEGLVQQYSSFEPIDDNFVNGELTLGENIGDLGGLNVAYEAYRLSLGAKEAPVIDGMTGDQRFFLGWAQVWRRLYRRQELLKRLITDPHSPSEYRVNGIVRNMDAWYRAFGVTENASLYLPPEDRVRIW